MKVLGFVKFDQNIDLIVILNMEVDVEQYGMLWFKFQGNLILCLLEVNNFDLLFENYFEDEGYVLLVLFYKDLVNWIDDVCDLINFINDIINDGVNYFILGFYDCII